MTIISGLSTDVAPSIRRNRDGFTLVELLVGLSLFMIVGAAVFGAVQFMARSAYSVQSYSEMNSESRRFLAILGEDLRSTTGVEDGFGETSFTLRSSGPTGPHTIEWSFDRDHPDRPVTRTTPQGTQTLLRNVDDAWFSFYDLQGNETATADSVKQVQAGLLLARQKGSMRHTQEALSGRVVLRNVQVSN